MHIRACHFLSQFLVETVQLLQCIQSGDSPSIFDPITEEGRQDLDLLSSKELRGQRLDHGGKIRDSFASQNWVFIVYIFA